MRKALVFAPLLVLLLLGPAPAPPPPPKTTVKGERPVIVIQASSAGKILTNIREGITYTCGPLGPKFLDEFNKNFEQFMGKEGLDGIDVNKPCVGYFTFANTIEETACVLAFPCLAEDKLLAMINRTPFRATPTNEGSGLYKLDIPNDPAPIPIRMRVKDGYAYLGINTPDASMTAEALFSAATLLDPNEKATLCITAQPNKVPSVHYSMLRDLLEQDFGRDVRRAEKNGEKFMADFIMQFQALCNKSLFLLEKDLDTVRWRLNFDSKTGLLTDEETFIAKPGTVFAREIETWGATQNRFAGFADPKAAVWAVTKVPVFNAEVRGMLNALLVGGAEITGDVPEIGQATVKALLALGKRTVDKGEGDLGFALYGPDKAGTFTVALAIMAEDTSAVEKELKALVKGIPVKDITDAVKFDVEKMGEVTLHEMAIGKLLPPDVQKVFGKEAMLCLGLSKNTIYAGFGTDARARVKAAVGFKPAAAPALDLQYNPVKLTALAKAIDENVGGQIASALGTDDKLLPFWTITTTGGKELTLKQTSGILTPYRVMFHVLQGLFGI